MKELLISKCEKTFLLNAINEGVRLDGRKFDESRPLKICFGSEWGSCHVSLGDTKVTSHISYKMEQPKQAKPNEGLLFINLDLGAMAGPNFENKSSEMGVLLNRLLEKCIIDSRCVDLESLCVVAEEKVWSLRVDIHVLNYAGNIIECASVAALASLSHFKRPDVTTSGEEIIVHALTEKDPIPMVLHHYPVCVLFGFFSEEIMVVDPSLLEETICSSDGALFTIGMNSYREVCLFNLSGSAITFGSAHIYRASQDATIRAKFLVDVIKNTLAEDEAARSRKEDIGFASAISKDKLTTLTYEKLSLQLNHFNINPENQKSYQVVDSDMDIGKEEMVISAKNDTATLFPKNIPIEGKEALWPQTENVSSEDDDNDINGIRQNTNEKDDDDIKIVSVSTLDDRIENSIVVADDSEESDVVTLDTEIAKSKKTKKKKNKK